MAIHPSVPRPGHESFGRAREDLPVVPCAINALVVVSHLGIQCALRQGSRGVDRPMAMEGQDGLTAGPPWAAGDLTIGTVRVHGRAILAPMAGVTDSGMRRIAMRFGAALTVSEMVAASSYAAGQPEAHLRAAGAGIASPAQWPRRPVRSRARAPR